VDDKQFDPLSELDITITGIAKEIKFFFYWGLTSLFTLFTEILLLGTKFVNLGPAGPSFFLKVEPCLKDFLHFRGKET